LTHKIIKDVKAGWILDLNLRRIFIGADRRATKPPNLFWHRTAMVL